MEYDVKLHPPANKINDWCSSSRSSQEQKNVLNTVFAKIVAYIVS